jgi:hypothetical protein
MDLIPIYANLKLDWCKRTKPKKFLARDFAPTEEKVLSNSLLHLLTEVKVLVLKTRKIPLSCLR